MAAGAVTISYSETRTVRKVTLAWTSDGAGAVNGTATKDLSGELLRVGFIPGSGGTQPTDLYDVVVLDADGVDVLAAAGADRSSTLKSQSTSGGRAIDGPLELQVTNAGVSKTGTVTLYLR